MACTSTWPSATTPATGARWRSPRAGPSRWSMPAAAAVHVVPPWSRPVERASRPGSSCEASQAGRGRIPQVELLRVECEGAAQAAGSTLRIPYSFTTGEFNFYRPDPAQSGTLEVDLDAPVADLAYPVGTETDLVVTKVGEPIEAINKIALTLVDVRADRLTRSSSPGAPRTRRSTRPTSISATRRSSALTASSTVATRLRTWSTRRSRWPTTRPSGRPASPSRPTSKDCSRCPAWSRSSRRTTSATPSISPRNDRSGAATWLAPASGARIEGATVLAMPCGDSDGGPLPGRLWASVHDLRCPSIRKPSGGSCHGHGDAVAQP